MIGSEQDRTRERDTFRMKALDPAKIKSHRQADQPAQGLIHLPWRDVAARARPTRYKSPAPLPVAPKPQLPSPIPPAFSRRAIARCGRANPPRDLPWRRRRVAAGNHYWRLPALEWG